MCAGALQLGGDLSVAVSGVWLVRRRCQKSRLAVFILVGSLTGSTRQSNALSFPGNRQAIREATF